MKQYPHSLIVMDCIIPAKVAEREDTGVFVSMVSLPQELTGADIEEKQPFKRSTVQRTDTDASAPLPVYNILKGRSSLPSICSFKQFYLSPAPRPPLALLWGDSTKVCCNFPTFASSLSSPLVFPPLCEPERVRHVPRRCNLTLWSASFK